MTCRVFDRKPFTNRRGTALRATRHPPKRFVGAVQIEGIAFAHHGPIGSGLGSWSNNQSECEPQTVRHHATNPPKPLGYSSNPSYYARAHHGSPVSYLHTIAIVGVACSGGNPTGTALAGDRAADQSSDAEMDSKQPSFLFTEAPPVPEPVSFVRARDNVRMQAGNQAFDARQRDLFAVLGQDGSKQTVLHLRDGWTATANVTLFDRDFDWEPGEGVAKGFKSSDCGTHESLTILGFNEKREAWAWFNERPCFGQVVESKATPTPTAAPPRATELVQPGSTETINCPKSILTHSKTGETRQAVGGVVFVGPNRSGDGAATIRIRQGEFTGEIEPTCDPDRDVWAAEFSRTADLPVVNDEPVLLHFWATWCAPCVKELPDYDAFAAEVGPNRTYAISEDFEYDRAAQFLARKRLSFPGGFDTNQDILERMGGSEALPYTVVLLPDGDNMEVFTGVIDWNHDARIRALMMGTDESDQHERTTVGERAIEPPESPADANPEPLPEKRPNP